MDISASFTYPQSYANPTLSQILHLRNLQLNVQREIYSGSVKKSSESTKAHSRLCRCVAYEISELSARLICGKETNDEKRGKCVEPLKRMFSWRKQIVTSASTPHAAVILNSSSFVTVAPFVLFTICGKFQM